MSLGEAAPKDKKGRSAEPVEIFVASTLAIAIIIYQGNIAAYFIPALESWPTFRPIYRGLQLTIITAVLFASIVRPRIWREEYPIVAFCFFCASLVLLHPVDHIARSYISSIGLFFCVALLSAFCNSNKVIFLSAVVTATNAIFCLIDIMTPQGFTNTPGRAAGLAEGPNLAAAELILGAAITWRALSKSWRASFLILVGFALFATLSRSSMMTAALVVVVASVPSFFRKIAGRPVDTVLSINLPSIALAVSLLIWTSAALIVNDRFSVAAEGSYQSLGKARSAMIMSINVIIGQTPLVDGFKRLTADDLQRLKTEELEDSASYRRLLFQRAIDNYTKAPPGGLGLQAAHNLIPHNSYLLFALAFGALGWLVPFGFIGLIARRAWVLKAWEAPVAATALLFLSHDLLLMPASIVLFAIGCSGPRAAIGNALADNSQT